MKKNKSTRLFLFAVILVITTISSSFTDAEKIENLDLEIININEEEIKSESTEVDEEVESKEMNYEYEFENKNEDDAYEEDAFFEDYENYDDSIENDNSEDIIYEENYDNEYDNEENYEADEPIVTTEENNESDWSDWSDFDGFSDFEGPTNDFNGYSGSESGGYSDDFGFVDEKEEHIPGKDFIKPKQTFQYNISEEGQYPVYIDTGIEYKEDESLHPEHVKEILRQISVKTNAKFVTDENRFIILGNDNFVVIDGNKDNLEIFLDAFEKVGVKLKVQSSRAGQKFNLADYLENQGELPVEINEVRTELLTNPVISDSRVLLPIRSIGEGLGADVKWNKDTKIATIKKDDTVIKIENNKDIITVNGKEYLIGKSTKMNNENDRVLSLVNLIVKSLDGEMKWNTTERVLKIKLIEETIEDDYY